MEQSSNYYLYLDECGDQNLANFDPSFPIFTLCGVIVSEEKLHELERQINDLKQRIWNSTHIICIQGISGSVKMDLKSYLIFL